MFFFLISWIYFAVNFTDSWCMSNLLDIRRPFDCSHAQNVVTGLSVLSSVTCTRKYVKGWPNRCSGISKHYSGSILLLSKSIRVCLRYFHPINAVLIGKITTFWVELTGASAKTKTIEDDANVSSILTNRLREIPPFFNSGSLKYRRTSNRLGQRRSVSQELARASFLAELPLSSQQTLFIHHYL